MLFTGLSSPRLTDAVIIREPMAPPSDLVGRYQQHLAETRARLDRGLGAMLPSPDVDLRPSPIDSGFRSHARFSVELLEGRCAVLGTDPLNGSADWRSTVWILPSVGRRLVERVVAHVEETSSRFPVRGFDLCLGQGTEQAHLVVAVDRAEQVSFLPWAQAMLERDQRLTGVSVPSQLLTVGEPFVQHRVCAVELRSHPLAFFQTNHRLADQLFATVRDAAGRDPADDLLDLYCGAGVHGLLAGAGPVLTGIDSDPRVVDVARFNARRLGRAARYIRADAASYLARPWPRPPALVLANPPRAGCGEAVNAALGTLRPPRVCLVCCSAESHARDLDQLGAAGYAVERCTAFDMFPFSLHVECVSELRLR